MRSFMMALIALTTFAFVSAPLAMANETKPATKAEHHKVMKHHHHVKHHAKHHHVKHHHVKHHVKKHEAKKAETK